MRRLQIEASQDHAGAREKAELSGDSKPKKLPAELDHENDIKELQENVAEMELTSPTKSELEVPEKVHEMP